MNPPADNAEPIPSAAADVNKLASQPLQRDANSWLKRNRKKLAVCIGVVVLVGFGLNAILNPVPETKPTQDTKPAQDTNPVQSPETKQVGDKPSSSNEAVKLNKAQWKAKLTDKYGALVGMGTIAGWNKTEFQQLMGTPATTQTVDGTAFWYFECSDGTIQLELNSGALSAGLMQGKINDY